MLDCFICCLSVCVCLFKLYVLLTWKRCALNRSRLGHIICVFCVNGTKQKASHLFTVGSVCVLSQFRMVVPVCVRLSSAVHDSYPFESHVSVKNWLVIL